jgi:hypothetical protein
MGLDDLRTDLLPLPTRRELQWQLALTNHAEQRFRERSAINGSLGDALQRAEDWMITRTRPEWSAEGISGEHPAFYLLFHLPDGDQGCLPLQYAERGDGVVAVTFFSRQSTIGDNRIDLQPLDQSRALKIKERMHLPSVDDVQSLARKQRLISKNRPAWLQRGSAEAWYVSSGWAAELIRLPVGAGNRFHYHWGRLYFRRDEQRSRSQKRYQRQQAGKRASAPRKARGRSPDRESLPE